MTLFVVLAAVLLALVLALLLAPLRHRASPRSLWAVALAVPLLSVAVYAATGRPDVLTATETAPDRGVDINAMVASLHKRLAEQPNDLQGWLMLARSHGALQQHREASVAYARAAALSPRNAQVLADQADALAMAQRGIAAGEPTRLVQRALHLDPNNLKALAIAATAANDRGDLAAAAAYWERARVAMAGAAPAASPVR